MWARARSSDLARSCRARRLTDHCFRLLASEDAAADAAARIETPMEEIGAATALIEIDEDAGVWELCAYATDETRQAVAGILRDALPGLAFTEEVLPDEDWVARSLEGLRAVAAGGFVVHGTHEREAARKARSPIRIDAGQAFGTGHHETTAGCLVAIDHVLRSSRPRSALDLGTGSGVLAIGIARRAKIEVLATDIDPVAVRIARRNARLNGASTLVRCATAAGLDHPVIAAGAPFDLVVANILARPLVDLAPTLHRAVAARGRLILSGLLSRQARAVLAAYRAQGLVPERRIEREGWATLVLRRAPVKAVS